MLSRAPTPKIRRMSKKNKSIYSVAATPPPETTLSIKDFAVSDIDQAVKIDAKKQLKHFPSIAEKLAKSSVYYRNWYYPESRDKFPYEVEMRCVDKMFPFADGGQLLVDEPKGDHAFDLCEKKAVILRELNYRYIIIPEHAEYADMATELESMDRKCLGIRR